MNIGLFTDTFLPVVDGVGRVVVAYAYTLSAMGHNVVVSSPRYEIDNRENLPFHLLDYQALKVPNLPQYRFSYSRLDAEYYKAMQKEDLEIAHAHSPFTAGLEAMRVAKEKSIPLVSTFHSKFYDDFYKIFKSDKFARILLKQVINFFEKCDEVWAVNEASAEVLRSYGYEEKPIIVMPNGVNIPNIDRNKIDEVEERYQLKGKPVLLYVGQIDWKKNILRILEAAALLKEAGYDFYLILAGQGPDKNEVEAKIKSLNLQDHTKLVGHISDDKLLTALYARACVFTFPSLYDNAPMVVREAAGVGTPSVLVRQSSASEAIEDGVNGFLCDDNSEDLARILQEIFNKPEETVAIGAKAKETIPISWETILEKTVERYRILIESDYNFRKKS